MENKLLTILRKISEIIADTDEYMVVLDKIVDVLSERLNIDVCSVYVYDDKTDQLVLTATHGLKKTAVGKVRMKNGEGLTGESFKHRKILNLSNPEKHPRFVYFKNTGEEKYKSFLSVPLAAGGQNVGMMVFQRVESERFSHAVVDMVKSLSTQLANLVLNAKMLQALTKQKRPSAKVEEDEKGQIMFRGLAANHGIAKGKAVLFESRNDFDEVWPETIENSQEELELLEKAILITKKLTVDLEKRALSMISEADASIFNVHLMFLEDKAFIDEIKREITDKKHTVEFSLKQIFSLYQKRFMSMGNPVFREKEMDLKDVMTRLLETVRRLRGGTTKKTILDSTTKNQVLIAQELLPSDLIRLPINNIVGIVCEKGGVTAHVAILAKALDIPALMGVKDAMTKIGENDDIIVDCHAELMYVRPSVNVIHHFNEMMKTGDKNEQDIDTGASVTLDGKEIKLRANISLICETSLLDKYGARGIGLYRTEFLYMIRDSLPTEETQYQVFSKILKEAGDDGASIRVLDIGADKPVPYIKFPHEDNPALGNRGIRLLLQRSDIFKTHLRAILRAGADGNLRILFPMVTSSNEMFSIHQVITEVEEELHANKIAHSENYHKGIMLEVPSAVFGLESLIDDIDYASIGSNDLLQYTFAVDRGNELVSEHYQPLHPVFLNVLNQIGTIFKAHPEKTLAMCGEMAGSPLAIPFLIGLGVHDLSMSPRQIPTVKKIVRSFKVSECEELVSEALSLKNPEAVSYLVKEALTDKGLEDIII